MIKINLIKSQVPSQIDLPKKRKSLKSVIKATIVSIFSFLVILFGVYFVFIKKSEQISVQIPQKHAAKTTITHKNIIKTKEESATVAMKKQEQKKYTINKQKNNKFEKNEVSKVEKASKIPKQTSKHIETKHKKQKTQENTEKILQKLKKTVMPVFSLNIKLNNIPKPIIPNVSKTQNKLYQEIINDNVSQKKAQKIASKKSVTYEVKVTTKSLYSLKRYLKKEGIKYKYKKIVYKTYATYEIFVGGFDSYPKIVRFAMDLKSKGYKIYKISNIDLLFYACINKNANEDMRNRYIEVWSKTPFKILTIKHKKNEYAYLFEFKCSKKQFNLLKKRGYYPIILKSYKNGA